MTHLFLKFAVDPEALEQLLVLEFTNFDRQDLIENFLHLPWFVVDKNVLESSVKVTLNCRNVLCSFSVPKHENKH